MEKDYCVHPGNIMRAVLMSINKSQKWLAKEMNVNKTVVSSLLAGKKDVTTMVAAAFERATGYPAESLLHQQKKYELFQLGKEEVNKSRFEICEDKRGVKEPMKSCRECDHRYGNMCRLFEQELTSYGNVGDDDWGYIRCDECKQAEVKYGEDKG